MGDVTTDRPDDERLETYESALHAIVQWADAYLLDVFPEPNLKRAHMVLKDHGMGLDAISAHAMRHVLVGVRKIASEALNG